MEALGLRDDMGDKSAIAAQNSLQLIAFSSTREPKRGW